MNNPISDSSRRMTSESINIVLETPDGFAVLDKYGRNAKVFSSWTAHGVEAEHLSKWCLECNNAQPGFPVRLVVEVHVCGSVSFSEKARMTLMKLVEGASQEGHQLVAVAHIEKFDCSLRHAIRALVEGAELVRRVRLIGRMPECDETDLRIALESQFEFYEHLDWYPTRGLPELSPNIERNARLGLLLPVLCYVHGPCEDARPVIDRVLQQNYHSGFSLAPAFLSPFWNPSGEQMQPIAPDEWCSLLVDAYTEYRSYDASFEYVGAILSNVLRGGWCETHSAPSRLRLLVLEDGSCAQFRQIPHMRSGPLSLSEINSHSPAALMRHLVAEASNAFAADCHDRCRVCQWRYLCGGLDRPVNKASDVSRQVETVCASRELFFEFFIRELHNLPARSLSTNSMKEVGS